MSSAMTHQTFFSRVCREIASFNLGALILFIVSFTIMFQGATAQDLQATLGALTREYAYSHVIYSHSAREMLFFWTANVAQNKLSMAAIARATGYVGIGFSPSGFMVEALAIVCRNVPNQVSVDEVHLAGYVASQVFILPPSHITNPSLSWLGDHLLFEVEYNVAIPNRIYNFTLTTPTRLIFSASPDSAMNYHGDIKMSNQVLTFSDGTGRTPYEYNCYSCGSHGRCGNSFFCQCDQGWLGPRCDQADPTYQPPSTLAPTAQPQPMDLAAAGFSRSRELFPGLTMYWKPPTSTHVTIALRGVANGGYVAVGWTGTSFRMIPADAVIGWVQSGTVNVNAYTLADYSSTNVLPNTAIPLTDIAGEEVGGVTTIIFTRPLNAGQYPISSGVARGIIGAFSPYDRLEYHSRRTSALISVDFMRAQTPSGPSGTPDRLLPDGFSLFTLHAILMMAAWGFLMPLSMFIARFARGCGNSRSIVHLVINIIGSLAAVTGVIVAFIMVGEDQFATVWHAQVGLTIAIILIIQVILGLIRPNPQNDLGDKTLWRLIWEWIHPWIGRIILLAAFANALMGIRLIQWSDTAFILYFFWGVVVICLFFVLEVLRCCRCCGGCLSGQKDEYSSSPAGGSMEMY